MHVCAVQVVLAARPAAVRAEECELEALHLRQLAADTEFHGEVGGIAEGRKLSVDKLTCCMQWKLHAL